MKEFFPTAAGLIGSAAAYCFGGWDAALITLVIFMAIDYFTGLLVAGVFHRSPKSPDGRLESRAGFKGLLRKGMMLLIVLIAVRLDAVIGPDSTFLRDAAAISLTVNDGLSILENMVLMGVPVPDALKNALSVLGRQAEVPSSAAGADPDRTKTPEGGADDDPAL
ncbi:MAG: phage holin family protein [Clostridia bacterium]|nr:phage holin family protein [Clostridia bacterium]